MQATRMGLFISKFQSTLPREERQYFRRNQDIFPGFQSTLPREERLKLNNRSGKWSDFNPRSHERSDDLRGQIITSTLKFQSTLPREERRNCEGRCKSLLYFNPRSHERSDSNSSYGKPVETDFNPRSHERSDENASLLLPRCSRISIHAPTRGATSAG